MRIDRWWTNMNHLKNYFQQMHPNKKKKLHREQSTHRLGNAVTTDRQRARRLAQHAQLGHGNGALGTVRGSTLAGLPRRVDETVEAEARRRGAADAHAERRVRVTGTGLARLRETIAVRVRNHGALRAGRRDAVAGWAAVGSGCADGSSRACRALQRLTADCRQIHNWGCVCGLLVL
jgi:hypothetical protein